jgi:hypothetical protein
MLNRISSGWTWLETALNAVIDEVNRQKPLPSTTIAVEESPTGSLLKVTQASQGGGTGGPSGGQWCQIMVKDTSTGVCQDMVIWYWGTPPATLPGPPQPS